MPALGDIAELVMGQSPPSTSYNREGDGLPFFQGKVDFGRRTPRASLYCSAPAKVAQPGDILIAVRAPVGPVNVAVETCCIGRGLAAIRPEEINRDFLYFQLRHLEPAIAALGTGSTFKAINRARLAAIEVNPQGFDAQAQLEIAHVLNLCERALEVEERSTSVARELKEIVLTHILTGSGQEIASTPIGEVPADWNIRPLRDYLLKAQYGLSAKGSREGQYPLLRMTNQRGGAISLADLQYVDVSDDALRAFRVERGDLLFNRTNSHELVGRTAIFDLDDDCVFASYLIRLRTDAEKLRPHFLNYYLNWHDTQIRLKSIATRAVSQSNISAARLGAFPIAVPSLDRQDEIVGRLRVLDRNLALHERRTRALQDLFDSLLDGLVTGRVQAPELVEVEQLEGATVVAP
jgi:type I restriction enzyme S subunit